MVLLGTVCYILLTTWSVAIWSQQDCIGLECQNGGVVQVVDKLCSCSCPFQTSGLFCEYVLQESVFPDGSYALPMSVDGCPEGGSRGWGQGYINITTTRPLDEPHSFPEHCRQAVADHMSEFENNNIRFTNIIGPFGHYSLQMNFCLKSNKHPINSKSWPAGAFGIFKTMDECPDEFSEHEMKLCLPPLLHYNADGELPYYEIKELVNYTELKFRYCRRFSVETSNNSLRTFNPFLVIKDHNKTSLECPGWDGYIVNEESFPFSLPTTILDQSTSDAGGMFSLRYCHFTTEHYGFTSKNKEVFQDSDFPDGSYALPMSPDGCPEGASQGWGQGYINLTTKDFINNFFTYSCTQTKFDRFSEPNLFYIGSPFGKYYLQMNFCVKSNKHPFNNSKSWPTGAFGIFRTKDKCPNEFSEHEMKLCFPPLSHYNTDGELPDYEIHDLVKRTELTFRYCRRLPIENAENTDHSLRSFFPFLVIKDHGNTSLECPDFDGFIVFESRPFHHDFHHVDVPTTILDRNSSDTSEMFPLTYCHYSPDHYGFPSENEADRDLIYKNGFPGVGHKVTGISSVFNPCWNHLSKISYIYVSDTKWSFLNGGALLCRHKRVSAVVPYEGVFMAFPGLSDYYRCYRSHHGRYVTLTSLGRILTDLKIYKSFDVAVFSYNVSQVTKILERGDRTYSTLPEIAMMLNNTDVSSERCNQELGMIDRGIADSQLTASSWHSDHPPMSARPQHQGWCAAENDTEPYIQIDLRFVTSVDGIRLYNWFNHVETLINNVRMKTLREQGPALFKIEYGVDEKYLTSGKLQIFKYDRSQSLEDPQTFLLVNPILARFVRFLPKPFAGNNRTCMKFELLGCKTSDLLAIECPDSRPRMTINTSLVFLPFNQSSTILTNTSKLSCESYCLYNISDCVALQFKADTSCTVFTADGDYNYLEHFQLPDTLSVLCVSERQHSGSFMLGESWKMSRAVTEFEITKTGFFTSPGFPITYPYNAVFTWRVYLDFTVETHVSVQFTHISLRIFKEDDKCHDRLILSLWRNKIILTSKDNGQTPSFDVTMQTNMDNIPIYFELCPSGELVSDGNGFRALIYSSERTPCFLNLEEFSNQDKECSSMTGGELIADSFLGQTMASAKRFSWNIDTRNHIIITLKLIEIEVICSTGSRLILPKEQVVCNENRPYGDQTNVVFENSIEIVYLYSAPPIPGINQGFLISYHMRNTEINPEDDATSKDNDEECSSQFGKCYTISISTNSSWKDVAENCRKRNTFMVSLKAENELRFVRSLIMKHYKTISETTKTTPTITKIQVNIGLFSFTDSSGKLLESWFDGSAPTYTAWDSDQPFRRHILQCTQMHIQNPNVTNSWSSCYCDKKYDFINFAVCERAEEGYTPLEMMSPTSNYDVLSLERRDPVTLFECTSGEWMSRLVACNGIAECFDASDETKCIYNNVCEEDEFECADGTCIHVSEVCDYKLDCSDKSDEFCEYSDCKDQFKCENGQCISNHERCDSVKHCKDGSDEINCDFCNAEKAFHCILSRTCVSKRLVCDKFEDCPGGTDEQQCNDIHFDTCKDIWLNGQYVSGYFEVYPGEEGKDVFMYCNFDSVYASGNLEMTIFNTDTIPMTEYRYEFRAPVDLYELTRRGFHCTQRIETQSDRHRLRPMTANNTVDTIYVYIPWICDRSPELIAIGLESTIIRTLYHVHWIKNTYGVYLKKPLKPGNTINRGDIICNEMCITNPMKTMDTYAELVDSYGTEYEHYHSKQIQATLTSEEITNKKLFCREGISAVSTHHRCLYERDTNGYVTGCRTLEHLNNCDNFVCPEHFFKCPRSYCIPLMYVCDGNNDCAYGDDELFCACPNNPPADIVILAAVSIHGRALQLAGMLYSPSPKHRVRILQKMTHDNNLIGTEILTNTKYGSKANISYSYTDVGELFKESESIRTLIVISEDKDMDEIRSFLLLSNLLSAKTNVTYKLYNVTIVKASNRLITKRESNKSTEIILKDETIIGTIGHVLFPELCNGTLSCEGLYRCRLSKVCIPQNQVCDNTTHCPYGDDEDHCDFVCPSNCSCDVLSVNCSNVQMNGDFNLSVPTRVLDISHSQSHAMDLLEKFERKLSFPFLLRLNASWCGLNTIKTDAFKFIPNLISLDLSYNNFSKFEQNMFVNLKSLKYLFLIGNIFLTSIDQGAFNGLQLKSLTITGTKLSTLKANTFAGSSLTSLNIEGNELREIDDFAFNGSAIEVLNIFEKSIEGFGKNIFSGIVGLMHLTTPAYKFCCLKPILLAEENCLPLKDEFSSCTDLMRNTALQALLWTIGLLALFGNLFSLFYRLNYDRKKMKLGYGIFVTNLAVSDLLMGIYMLIIAVADTLYRDRYIEHDDYWRKSGWCKFAGILSTISSEGSVFFVFLITLDRFFVVKFPFGQIRFKTKSAMLASITVWIVVLLIAVLPVVYVDYFQERFYSKTGVCLALPLTRDQPPGWLYSILIFIVFNMIAFILIAAGQWLIFLEIKKNSMTKKSMNVSRRENDLKVARNLLLVVTTDFACWFPVCTMGLMALSGYVIPGEVYAWTAVLILPVNSALNPFLYTISAIYGAKKFTPSEDEQSHVNTEVGKDFSHVVRDVLTNKLKPSRRRRVLNDLLKDPRLTTYEAARVIYQVARLLHHLHENGLVLKDIVKEDILLENSVNGQIKKIRVDTARGLQWSPKKEDFCENVFKLGQLADDLLQEIDSTSL